MNSHAFAVVSLVAIAIAGGSAMAQESKPAMPAATVASMPTACGSAMKRHDHGAERNVPSAKSLPCAPAEAASNAKAKPIHDHSKFHKNQ